jgi:hypothetical protein
LPWRSGFLSFEDDRQALLPQSGLPGQGLLEKPPPSLESTSHSLVLSNSGIEVFFSSAFSFMIVIENQSQYKRNSIFLRKNGRISTIISSDTLISNDL